ncbi:ASCH domain-containing protein [Simiduia curdlanivorans]|uniref:ASCH domain-containing protein n=1 Tax=Simiduia curdlanivorans TaxID=1492769 RepID=A0ABV8V117_9GAMM|nr:ASCH domain-containing protein [Simiduia curdlanivorans]MDN3637573.1 ASCH domain-containing protein [Simiduia curdlanivorans]
MNDAIISIRPRHVENILSGNKTVELRTRSINLPSGSRLWIYTTLPVGKIKLSTEIDFVEVLPPKAIWKKYGKNICIPKKEFDEYTKDRELVAAIGLRNIQPLERDICLDTLRKYEENFQPPQFFSRLNPDRALYSAFYA